MAKKVKIICHRCGGKLQKDGSLYYCNCGAVWARFFAPNEIWEIISFDPLKEGFLDEFVLAKSLSRPNPYLTMKDVFGEELEK